MYSMLLRYGLLTVLTFVLLTDSAQGQDKQDKSPSGGYLNDLSYDPSPAHPFGRPNPNAPKELSQFAFFIGNFDCSDKIRNADGTWNEFSTIWNGAYFLNGYGIQDYYWSPRLMTSNIRIYEPQNKHWRVSFFSAPGFSTGVWTGVQHEEGKDRRMVLTQTTPLANGKARISKLTFYDINPEGFEWHAENSSGDKTVISWTSSCHRRH